MEIYVVASYYGQEGWAETDPGYYQVESEHGALLYMDGECLELIEINDSSVTLRNELNEECEVFTIPIEQYKRDMVE